MIATLQETTSRATSDGQGMIEFALILPVFLLLLVGMIEFGSAYSKIISMRQGIREAGRQGSVANWGSTSSCGLTQRAAGGHVR